MTKKHHQLPPGDQVRHKAERLARDLACVSESSPSPDSIREMRQLLHQIHDHQVELETQNEELQRIRVELENSRARFCDLFEQAPVGYLTISADGLVQEANLTAAALLGLPRSDLLQQPFARYVHPDDVDTYLGQQGKIRETNAPLNCEIRMGRPDQTVFWAHLVLTAPQWIEGRPISRLVISDISEHKELESALHESQERYHRLFESASDALFAIESDSGRILDANARALELYAYTADELIGVPCRDLAATEDCSRWLVSEALSRPNGVLIVPAHLHKKKDGTVFPVEITARTLPLDGRQCFLMAVRDISERKHMEAVMAARLRLLRAANSKTLDDLLQATLDEAEALTNSQFGFFHLLHPDQETVSLYSWSTNSIEHLCNADRSLLHDSVKQAGVRTECIHQRRSVIHNDYAGLQQRKGVPPGHVEIIRELLVPVLRDGAVVALIGLGNKPADYNQQDVQVVATLADLAWEITLRKRTETDLRESEEQHRLLFEAASDALLFITADTGQISQANQQAMALYGYDHRELLGMKATALSAEEDKTRQFLKEASEHPDRAFHVPIRLHRKMDGTIFPVEITGRSVPYKGHPGLLIAIRDISERIAAEMALRISEQKRLDEQKIANAQLSEQAENLSSIYQVLDSVGLIVCELVDDDAHIREFNTGAEKLFGYQRHQAIGASIGLIYPPENLDIIPDVAQRLREGKVMQSFNTTLVRCSGERFPAVVSVHPFSWAEGRCKKVVGIFRDISDFIQVQLQLEAINEDLERRVEQRTRELQETQKQYMHAEKLSAIGKLSASIAHEFNNPLQAILSILKGLQKRAILEPEDKELLQAAIGESERIKELIRSLQEFNRPSSGKKALVDIHQLLDSMLLLYKNDFKKKRITVECRYAPRLPQIMAVSDQIKQVFLNLLTNAADACRISGCLITITTRREQEGIAIAISDTGVGIEPENLESIFQPFFTTKPDVKGSGLGLSVCHGIITNHGGAITVESQPGAGATFIVRLPIKVDSARQPAETCGK
ncbi:MAG: PAS domain S-box protein [Desulfobulbus sp.]